MHRLITLNIWCITFPSANALIQLPSDKSDRLILAPSLNRSPRFLVTVALSDPARSISDNLDWQISVDISAVIDCCLRSTWIKDFGLGVMIKTFWWVSHSKNCMRPAWLGVGISGVLSTIFIADFQHAKELQSIARLIWKIISLSITLNMDMTTIPRDNSVQRWLYRHYCLPEYSALRRCCPRWADLWQFHYRSGTTVWRYYWTLKMFLFSAIRITSLASMYEICTSHLISSLHWSILLYNSVIVRDIIPGFSGLPSIVWVLPAPVAPYAKTKQSWQSVAINNNSSD